MDAVDLTTFWGALTIGAPVAVVGYGLMLSGDSGGLGFSASQLLLVIPLGVVLAVGLLWSVARPSAAYGEGTSMMLRPALGVLGSWLYLPVQLALMVVLASLELRIVGDAAAIAMGELGWAVSRGVGIGITAAVTLGIGLAGIRGVRWWIRRIAFWGGLATALWVIWRLIAVVDIGGFRNETPSPHFWLGVDMILGLAILFFPLVGDTTRLVDDESTASASVGAGFGVPALLVLLAGGLGAVVTSGGFDPAVIIGQIGGPVVGIAAVVVLLLWLLTAELDQPLLFLFIPAETLMSRGSARTWQWMVPGVVVAAILAGFVDAPSLLGIVDFLVSVLTPIVGVFLADFFVVRRKGYLSGDLYDDRGVYRGVQVAALPSLVLGFLLYQVIHPVGASWWIDTVVRVIPVAPLTQYGTPPVLTVLLFSMLLYIAVGSFTIRPEVVVSKLRI